MSRKKIACIGSGNIGGEAASFCAMYELGDIVLVDTTQRIGIAQGKAADILHASAITQSDVAILGTDDFAHIEGADVCIVSAGIPRISNISRDDLFDANVKVIADVAVHIRTYAPDSFVIVITNPLDVMTYTLWKASGLSEQKVVGMAGILDSSRFRSYIASAVHCSVKDINALVLGSHGDLMVPVISYCSVNGIPVKELLSDQQLEEIVHTTRFQGGALVKLMGTSAFYAAAKAACLIAESHLKDQKRVMPCSTLLTGHYGIDDAFIGVPVLIGAKGVERILELNISPQESMQLKKSAEYVREMCRKADTVIQKAIR